MLLVWLRATLHARRLIEDFMVVFLFSYDKYIEREREREKWFCCLDTSIVLGQLVIQVKLRVVKVTARQFLLFPCKMVVHLCLLLLLLVQSIVQCFGKGKKKTKMA